VEQGRHRGQLHLSQKPQHLRGQALSERQMYHPQGDYSNIAEKVVYLSPINRILNEKNLIYIINSVLGDILFPD